MTICFSDIVALLSPYIYNYPRIVFGSDSDRCGDFYEYVLQRLDRILVSYHETEAKFVTWFTVVLRNRYLNFLRERKTGGLDDSDCDCISLDYRDMNTQSLHNFIAEKRDYVLSEKQRYDELIERISSGLNENQRIFFHLYYIDALRPEDAVFISVTLNRSVRVTLAGINELKESIVHRYKRRQDNLERLNVLHREIVRSQKDHDTEALARYREKRDRLLEEYRRIKIHPSYESLARFLAVPLGTVSTGISRMKRAVREILKELYHEELPL